MNAQARDRVITRQQPLAGPPLPPFTVRRADPDPGIPVDRSVRIAELSPEKKRRLWAWLQIHDAPTVAILQSADVRAILSAFPGSSPVLDIATVRKALA